MTGSTDDLADIVTRHRDPVEVEEALSLLNYAEAPRIGEWTLRSALVRLAQPHPLRAEAVLGLVRRLDAALKPFVRTLQKHAVVTGRTIPPSTEGIADARVVDLALLSERSGVDITDVVRRYGSDLPLNDAEIEAAPLVALALTLDELADRLAAWASADREQPPLDAIDRACAEVHGQLERLGVPTEDGWRPGYVSGP
jgi:hypothetical protein